LNRKIEVIKTFDGIERRLGWRNPGMIFGEVPIALGTTFPGGYRAVEPSRVIGADAETGWLPAEVARDARGYVLTGDDLKKAGRWSLGRDPYLLETSVPGVFACGDVRLSPVKRVASAVGEGSMAIAFVHQYLAYSGQTRRRRTLMALTKLLRSARPPA
jgi:hypothetical protein